MIREHRKWARLIECDTLSKLNDIIYRRDIDNLKWIAEGLHEQKLAQIAKEIVAGFNERRIVMIAGPSCSNKSTFAKRLSIQLMVNGHKSLVLYMDDYYRDTCDIPKEPDGLQDFEALSAFNVEVLSNHCRRLLAGERVPRRVFSWKMQQGFDNEKNMMVLPRQSVLIIEGIHGLNPELLSVLGRESVVTVYVSALTPISLDYNHRFPTSDLRLIRRIIRDHKYRGYSPRQTILRWTSVRIGEQRHIFPFQGLADHFFDSALVYELPVLAIYGKALLAEATMPDTNEGLTESEAKEVSKEARRLSNLLNLFYPVSVEVVPHISCIREFIGGSDLKF
jgi:uridine kinase